MSNIPIIGAQEQPTFPQIGCTITPQGMIVIIQLGPTTTIQQFIDAPSMDGIVKQWQVQKVQAATIMRAVENSRKG